MWTFHSADHSEPTARSIAEQTASRLEQLRCRELDLVSRLSILDERHSLYPNEVTDRQVAELNRKLDEIREEIASITAPEHNRT